MLLMKEHTRGEDMFQSFKNLIEKTQITVCKLASTTMDEGPTIAGRSNGLAAKCRNDSASHISLTTTA